MINPRKLGATNYQQSIIQLEPRFIMNDVQKIEEIDFPTQEYLSDKPYIICKKNCDVEMKFKSDQSSNEESRIITVTEIILILNSDKGESEDLDQSKEGGKKPFNSYLGNNENTEVYYSTFNAMLAKPSHGKIKGFAYCKEVIYYKDSDIPLTKNQVDEDNKNEKLKGFANSPFGKLANSAGCFPLLFGKRRAQLAGLNVNGPIGANGCFGRNSNPIAGNIGLPPSSPTCFQSRGCFGPSSPSGCMPTGCMPLLFLAFLAGLLYWLLNQQGCNNNTTPPIIIHDTIKVEVIKEKIDTLTIIKTDTLSYVDSTTKLNYETVSLPNVQFYTNSDTLLPSSASDLQKLAEYLIKNDSLNATIFGHTDNVGTPSSNLQLSQRRAESVKRFLTSLGVKESRLGAVGMGDKEPKADNSTNEGRLMNRRVEVKLTQTEFVSTKRSKSDSRTNAKENNPNE